MTTFNGGSLHSLYASCTPGVGVPWARCKVRTCRAPLRGDGTACTGHPRHPVEAPALRYYASRTSTAANLAELHARAMRLLAGPDQLDRYEGSLPPLPWALDNGAWGCFQAGRPFDTAAFRRALRCWGEGADWIALPDIVCGGAASLALSRSWLDEVAELGRPMLLVVQDGMTAEEIRPLVGRVGIFVGGSTDGPDCWKESSLPMWGALAKEAGCHLHVGRVNTARRIQLAIDAGAHSADGTSLTKYSVNADRVDRATRNEVRLPLFGGGR